jgi:hypothetical protein
MADEKRGEGFVIHEPKRIEFTTFVLGLAHTSLIHLGDAPNPDTGRKEPDLELARESIELLSMLREKTTGNLSSDEERVFDDVLARLRLRYVEASKR